MPRKYSRGKDEKEEGREEAAAERAGEGRAQPLKGKKMGPGLLGTIVVLVVVAVMVVFALNALSPAFHPTARFGRKLIIGRSKR